MLSEVEVFNSTGKSMGTLPLARRTTGFESFFIKRIEGLDPVDADLSFTNNPQGDGTRPQLSRVGNRNIVMTIGFGNGTNYLSSPGRLRRELYRWFAPKSLVKLRFNEAENYMIDGYVESTDVALFESDMQAVVSIICPNPFFYVGEPRTLTSYDGEAISGINFGTADVGFKVKFFPKDDTTQITLINGRDDNIVIATPVGRKFIGGETVEISTVFGNKYALHTRQWVNTPVNILDGIRSGGLGMKLSDQIDEFRIHDNKYQDIPFELTIVKNYIGI